MFVRVCLFVAGPVRVAITRPRDLACVHVPQGSRRRIPEPPGVHVAGCHVVVCRILPLCHLDLRTAGTARAERVLGLYSTAGSHVDHPFVELDLDLVRSPYRDRVRCVWQGFCQHVLPDAIADTFGTRIAKQGGPEPAAAVATEFVASDAIRRAASRRAVPAGD